MGYNFGTISFLVYISPAVADNRNWGGVVSLICIAAAEVAPAERPSVTCYSDLRVRLKQTN